MYDLCRTHARLLPPVIATLLIAGCGSGEKDEPLLPPEELAKRIEVLRTARTEEELRPPRLGRLTPPEVGTRFRGRPSCRLEAEGRTLLVQRGNAAVARIDDKVRLLAAAGPVTSSGAYFEAPGVTMSIGRRVPVAAAADVSGISWPAGVTIGGNDKVPIEKRDAQWRCLV